MRIIAHRGNIKGPNPNTENSPDTIDYCISKGYDVEIDFWYENGQFFLGHDEPTYEISFQYLTERKNSLWIHCKNQDGLFQLNNTRLNYFWHQEDDVTLTSKEFIWSYPNKQLDSYRTLIVLDFSKNVNFDFYRKQEIYAVCVDYTYDK